MGRLSRVQDEVVFAAVGRQLAKEGVVTLQSLVAETGVSVGSLYHRYGSREALLARTWLDAVRAFQAMFLQALDENTEQAGMRAAMATPMFCRAHKERAVVLICCRQSEFMSDETPQDLQEEILSINKKAFEVVASYSKATGYSLEACRLGLVAFPLGAVRSYLPDREVPPSLDTYVAAAFRSAVQVG